MPLPFHQQPIAIVGMGCRLPGSSSLDAYWKLIESGESALGELPPSRLNQQLYFDPNTCSRPRTLTRLGGIVDPYLGLRSNHHLTAKDIAAADPAQLELVSVTEDAIAHAGWTDDSFLGKKTGVYVGHTRGTGRTGELVYRSLVAETAQWLNEVPAFAAMGPEERRMVIDAIVQQTKMDYPGTDRKHPERLEAFQGSYLISRAFNLNGPAVSLNAACASSLIALSYATQALRLGAIDVAVVGGGSFVEFDSLVLFSRAGSVSKTGSRPFDAGADGLVAAEGYVILLLKTLEKAIQDGDSISAVIRGTGYSSDGKGKSLWAPRKEGQVLAIERAFGQTLSKKRVQYVEAHATSTAVGDAIEMSALSEAFSSVVENGAPRIPIGSVKANIGHTLETAGLAGLVKAVLAIQHKTIPPVAYIGELNAKVDWANSPLVVPPAKAAWESPSQSHPRRVGVNAFGIGGLNAHIVIDEYCSTNRDQYFEPDCELNATARLKAGTSFASDRNLTSSAHRNEPVAVIGLGVISPAGFETDSFWKSVVNGQVWLSSPPAERLKLDDSRWDSVKSDGSAKLLGGFLEDYQYDWRKHKVPPKQVEAADPLQFMLLDAVDQAIRNTGMKADQIPRERTGVVIGSVFGGEFGNQLQMGLRLPEFSEKLQNQLSKQGWPTEKIEETIDAYQSLLLARMPALIDETGSFTSSTLASRITKTFDVMGGGSAIDSGGISGLAALDLCINILRTGDSDLMICAAGQRSCGQMVFDQMMDSRRLNTSGSYSVGNKDPEGLVPGEGVAVLVLKRLSDAQRDGNRIYSVIHSIETARHEKLQDAYVQVDRALVRQLAATSCTTLQYVESCANGTDEDSHELESISQVFGPLTAKPIPVCSLKEQVGETFGAASLMAVVRASLALSQRTVPAAAKAAKRDRYDNVVCPAVSNPIGDGTADFPSSVVVHAACENSVSGLLLTNVAALQNAAKPPETKIAISTNAIGLNLKGRNAADPGWVRFGADTISELLSDLQACTRQGASAQNLENRRTSDWSTYRYRLNIVASDEKALSTKLGMAIHALDQNRSLSSLQNQGVFFAQKGSSPNAEIAFVYSGQGSQYPRMLESLVTSDPDCKLVKGQLDSIVQTLGLHSFEEIVKDAPGLLGVELRRTQLGILGCEVLLTTKLKALNIVPNRIAGHSFGEYGAMFGAGCWDIRTAMQASVMRSDSVSQAEVIPGRLLCAFCDEKTANFACNSTDGQCFVANCNTASQTVIGGTEAGLVLARSFLEKNRIRAVPLNVPFAFHTPLMKSASAVMNDFVGDLSIQAPACPLFSSVSESYVQDVGKLRLNLVEQFVKPVRWTHMLESLSNHGVHLFVEVGPGQVLTGLNRNVFKDREEIICVATDDPKSDCAHQLVYVRAAVEIFQHLSYASQISMQWTLGQKPQCSPSIQACMIADPLSKESQSRMQIDDSTKKQNSFVDTIQLIATQPVKSSVSKYRSDLLAQSDILLGIEYQPQLKLLAAQGQVTPESLLRWNIELQENRSGGQSHYVSFPTAKNDGLAFHGFHDQVAAKPNAAWAQLQFSQHAPKGYLKHVVAGSQGQIGGLLGMNEAGISISSIVISSRKKTFQPGLLQSIVTLRVLRESDSLESAAKVLEGIARTGHWGVLILDTKSKRGTYIEYDDNRFDLLPISESFFVSAKGMSEKSRTRNEVNGHPTCDPSQLLRQLNGSSSNMEAVWSKVTTRTMASIAESRMAEEPNQMELESHRAVLLSPQNYHALASIQLGGHPTTVEQPVELHFSSFLNHVQEGDLPKVHQNRKEMVPSALPAVNHTAANVDRSAFVIEPTELAAKGNSINDNPPLGDTDLICTRLGLRLIEMPIPSEGFGTDLIRDSKVILLGGGTTSQLLSQRLALRGAQVAILEISSDAQSVLSQWQDCVSRMGQPDHLFFVQPSTNKVSGSALVDASHWQELVLTPYLVAQQWFSAFPDSTRERPMLFVAVTSMGGDLGIAGQSDQHYGGAWSGLSKAMFLERSVTVGIDLRTQAIDFDPDCSDESKVELIFREIDSKEREAELAYRNGKRHVLRMVHAPLSLTSDQRTPFGKEGCWIVTGGARGVTAEIAKRIGKLHGGTIHLVGSSPLPEVPQEWLSLDPMQTRELRSSIVRKAIEEKKTPADVWNATEKAIEIAKNLMTMTAQGIRIQYHACDISQLGNVARLVDKIRGQGEPIVGVVHGAGYEKASRFSGKKLPLVMRTLESKVLGAIHLMQATATDPLRSFVAFTSISGRYGAIGQTDYGTANEWLAKVVARYQTKRPEVHAVAMDWHSWDEVGMAARPETKHSKLLATMRFMPVNEGVDHFMKELVHRTFENEVIITDWRYHKMFFADPVTPLSIESSVASPTQVQQNVSNKDSPKHEGVASCEVSYSLGQSPADLSQELSLAMLGDVILVGDHPVGRALCNELAEHGVGYRWMPWRAAVESEEQTLIPFAKSGHTTLFFLSELDADNHMSRGWQHHLHAVRRSQGLHAGLASSRASTADSSTVQIVVAASLSGFQANGHGFKNPNSLLHLAIQEAAPGRSIEMKVVDLATDMSASARASCLIREAMIADGSKLVSHNRQGRYRIQKNLGSPSLTRQSELNKLSRDAKPVGLLVHVSSATPRSQSVKPSFVGKDLETKILEIRFEDLRASDSSNATDRLSQLQRQVSMIRKECGDRIREVCFVNEATLDASQQVLLVASLMELTRPDQLTHFTVLSDAEPHQHAAGLPSAVESWMQWYKQDRPEVSVRLFAVAEKNVADKGSWSFSPKRLVNTNQSDVIEYQIGLVPKDDPFLSQHLFRGRPLLPIVAIAEMFLQVAAECELVPSGTTISVDQLQIVNGLKFLDDEPKNVRVQIRKMDVGFDAKLVYSFVDSKGKLMDDSRVIAKAVLNASAEPECGTKVVSDVGAVWHGVEYPGSEMIIHHGPAFRCLSEVQYIEGGMVARLHVKANEELGGAREGSWISPMGIIDSSLFACGILAWIRDPSLAAIPLGVESMAIVGECKVGEQLFASIELKSFEKSKAIFDIDIRDQAGGCVALLRGFQATLVLHHLG
jgi:acyl transferase domain-containing protein/NAD(P)-dependent dehydrogenase (short-subunit alcohol dehydrogenase family)